MGTRSTTTETPKRVRGPVDKFVAAKRIAAILDQIPVTDRNQVLEFVRVPRQPELPLGNA